MAVRVPEWRLQEKLFSGQGPIFQSSFIDGCGTSGYPLYTTPNKVMGQKSKAKLKELTHFFNKVPIIYAVKNL